jgi:hypothetical protein
MEVPSPISRTWSATKECASNATQYELPDLCEKYRTPQRSTCRGARVPRGEQAERDVCAPRPGSLGARLYGRAQDLYRFVDEGY